MVIDSVSKLIEHGLILSDDHKYIKGCSVDNTLEGVIRIPESIKGFELGGNGFENCTKITHIILPDNFGNIGHSSFSGCSSLVSVNIPNSVNHIGWYAFSGCFSLQYIRIPSTTKSIQQSFNGINIFIDVEEGNLNYYSVNGSLYDKTKNTLVKYYCNVPVSNPTFPQNLLAFEDFAFSGCSMLRSIIIPSTIKELGEHTFEGCSNLESIIIPSNFKKIPCFFLHKCTSLINVEICSEVEEISYSAFEECENLKKIEINGNNCFIRSYAFKNCVSLIEVIIKGKTSISQNSFCGCDSLETISYDNANEDFLFTHLCDCKRIKKVISNSSIIDPIGVFNKNASQLKLMSMFYNGYGMNITKIKGDGFNYKSFKSPDKNWEYNWEDFYDKEQTKEMIINEDWYRQSGIGLVLGWNNYHAIDVDNVYVDNDCFWPGCYADGTWVNAMDPITSIEELIEDFLLFLGLPKDYPWVVKSGGGHGFHIIFSTNKLEKDFDSKSYTPNLHYVYNRWDSTRLFQRFELRWKDHLILPPSIHLSGNRYKFYNGIPNIPPSKIEIGRLHNLILKYCGRLMINTYTYKNCNFKLADYCKCFAKYDSWKYDVENKDDSIEWLIKANTPESLNSLGLMYILGNKVDVDAKQAKEYLIKSDSDASNFNLASLIACGFFKGSIKDVEYYLARIKDYKTFAYIEYSNYDDSIPKQLIQEIRKNASTLPNEINHTPANTIYQSQSNYLLFIDTETTGLPKDYDAPSSDILNWPRLVQLSWILCDVDRIIIKKGNYIIKPDGYTIPQESVNIHGISNIKAMVLGLGITSVLDIFLKDAKRAKIIIGHNVDYDTKVIGAELTRVGRIDILNKMESICTMKASTEFCKIPGCGGYKYPNLQELYHKLFNRQFENSHNSEADVHATMECYFMLHDKGIL